MAMHPSQRGMSYAQAIRASNRADDDSSDPDSCSDEEAPSLALVVARKRTSDDEAEPSLKEALKELKRQKTLAEEERRQRQAAESALQEHRQISERLSSENAELRRDREKMSKALQDARQGLRSDAPLMSTIPDMEAPDPTQPNLRVPTTETMIRLVSAMSVKAMREEDRRYLHDILRFDGRSMPGSAPFDRQSFRRSFDTNNLSIDMWNDVCADSDVFLALWNYCVRGHERPRIKARRSQAGQVYQRELKGSTAKVQGQFVAMLWHDGRTETADKWRHIGGAVSMARLRPSATAASRPTRQELASTSLTPTMGSMSVAATPRPASVSRERPPGAFSAPAAEEDGEECYYSSDPEPEEGVELAARPALAPLSMAMPPPPPPSSLSSPLPPVPVGVFMPSGETEVREPIPQRTERLVSAADDADFDVSDIDMFGEQDEDVCAVCGETGAVTECDGLCGKWFHWWCERPSHQPDQEKWMCTECGDGCEWAPRSDCPAETECVVCHERKPLTQFATMLPECPCADKGNRVCALCTCTLDLKAESYDQVRCPTCDMHKTSLKLRDGEVVNLVHRKDENGGCEHWADPDPEPAVEYRALCAEDLRLEAEERLQLQRAERLREAGKDKAGRLERRNARKGEGSGSDSS